MLVRRYTGLTLEIIRETIAIELGEHAVIINTQKKSKLGVFPGLKKVTYEVIAAVDDSVNTDRLPKNNQNAVNNEMLEVLLDEQKQQYKNFRNSIKFLDDKGANIDIHAEQT